MKDELKNKIDGVTFIALGLLIEATWFVSSFVYYFEATPVSGEATLNELRNEVINHGAISEWIEGATGIGWIYFSIAFFLLSAALILWGVWTLKRVPAQRIYSVSVNAQTSIQ